MIRHYSRTTGCTYLPQLGHQLPPDAVVISEELFLSVIANPAPGKIRSHDAEGLPILIDPPPVVINEAELCQAIDQAADTARNQVVGDPLRGEEYKLAAAEAQAFADAGYQGDVPRAVAAWVTATRTAQQAADHILAEAAQYNEALYLLRETRLQAKELIRTAMAAGQVEHAQDIADETIASIEAAVAGIGNNAG